MSSSISPIISSHDLLGLISSKSVVILDARYGNGKNDFLQGHLKGAFFADLDADLAEIKENPANGGRHPLPSISHFIHSLAKWGITNSTHVVVYDNHGGAFASRVWWMLKSVGHDKVQVLDGGFDLAVKNGFPIRTDEKPAVKSEPYMADSWNWPMANINEVENRLLNHTSTVIDVRGNPRYRGEFEPIDLVAGHIPGAINIPFIENLDSSGCFLSPEELRLKYADLDPEKETVVHCGSGVTACHTILAMAVAQLKIPTLYVGSWSEWSRNPKPVAVDLMRNTNQAYFNQESERLVFRKLTKLDIDSWSSFFTNNNRLHFLGIKPGKTDEELAVEWIDKQINRYNNEGLGLLALVDKNTNQLVGTCGIMARVINNQHEMEIGYSIKPEFWGKGYATEAAIEMREFGMKNKMANRFISIIHEENVDSMKVATKNQMLPLFNYRYLEMPVMIYGTK
tara:strand:- start:102524 stop:103885 length:1362 start_codon:yes stop_codon:yes gene_type:complete